jgi:hypothetical protein
MDGDPPLTSVGLSVREAMSIGSSVRVAVLVTKFAEAVIVMDVGVVTFAEVMVNVTDDCP